MDALPICPNIMVSVAATFWALSGVWDAIANGTHRYGGDDNGNTVVVGGGRVHTTVRIATTYLGPDPNPANQRGGWGEAGGWDGGSGGGEASPDGGGDRSSLSTSAAARGGVALLAIGGSLLILSLVLLRGGGQGGERSSITVGGQGGGLVPLSPRGPLSRQATGGRVIGINPLHGYPG